MSKKSSRLQMT